MITEKGKEYIARNFGVNNCYALEEVVPCTVYIEGAPNERVLDTSTILFLIVTECAERVKTAAGTFTLANLIAANDGSYISMNDALDIEAYCIAGAPPVTPPYVPPVTPPTTPLPGAKVFEILNPSVNCDSKKCYAHFNLKNNAGSGSAYVRLEVDGAPCYKRYAYIMRGTERPQVLDTSIADLSPGYHNLTIIVGKVTDTDSYTHRFLVAGAGIEPPAAAVQITPAEIAAELGRRGAIDTAAVSTTVGKDKWYIVHGEWGGTWLSYVATNFLKSISLDIDVRNPPTRASDITLKANDNVVNELDRSWVLARLGELSYTVTPGITIATDKATCRVNDTIYLKGQYIGGNGLPVVGHNIRFHSFINSTRTQIGSKKTQANGMYVFPYVPMVAGSWEFEAFNDYTSPRVAVAVTAAPPTTPPVTPPVTPTEPPEAIKAWVVANYGDGTRVTSDSADRLLDAMTINALAALPAGYTSASITQDVWKWARDNVGYKVVVDICGWIMHEGVKNLERNHARYIYSTAIGWTDAADTYYNQITPLPERIPVGLATKDNARAVYSYSIGWYDAGNTYSGCNIKE